MIKYRVIDTKGHLFKLGAIVTEAPAQFPRFFPDKNIYADDEGNQQVLYSSQVQHLDSVYTIVPRSLLDVMLNQPLPYPLASHFKACSNILELFETPATVYVKQCIDQVSLTPFERVTLLALFDAYLLEIA